ncbi:Gfo/Idh/MocA family oxidoreductase [Pelagicoccus mobilis]|uniref:Gfo/Idh/MocA family oxidoreductase n=1 Tax=Pelagicoccus mobilis TaxID=415221 RepID=A0A934VN23_9BACT|nr:Gfo/Idh/MocA family oxidoreductase [Pelagicoccus mobilis]MBK1875782.1 Gfo/Idh/MocA family oxidoreductase [Pelagicoccus mobilis]
MNEANTSRRDFIKKGAVATASTFILPRFSIGKAGGSANSKVNVAVIGTGGVAHQSFKGCERENIVALCDIDSTRFPKAFAGTDTRTFSDFRVMLDKMGKEIDAVCVNTPDHTHFPATIAAMERGINVCTQKPLTHNIWEARTLRKAMHKYKVITNMGNQGHTYNGIRTMREWYEAGVFGEVREVHLGNGGPQWGSKFFKKPATMPLQSQSIPDSVDWDLWLGPRAYKDYNEIYHPFTWRGFYDFGTGPFGDWFCHTGDGPVWILDLYEPTVIECEERVVGLDGMTTESSVVRFDFPARGDKAACKMYWYDGLQNGGTPIKRPPEWDLGVRKGSFWFADKQNGFLDHRSNNPLLSSREAMVEFKQNVTIEQKYPRIEQKGPWAEWISAIKGDLKGGLHACGSNFDYAAPMSEIALIGVLAQRFGGRLEWDAKKMRITNRPELNMFVKEPVRQGWRYGEDLWKS